MKGSVQAWITERRDVFDVPEIRRDIPTPYNTQLRFDRKDLTKAGGYPLFVWFCDTFGIAELLNGIRIKKRKSKYSILDLNLILLDMIILGIERISHMSAWASDALLPLLRGHDRLPHPSSLFRHIESFNERNIAELEEIQRKALAKGLSPRDHAILDLDATVITVYGKQEGSEVGYNPHKKGRPSYSLKAGFIDEREMVCFRLDPGNTVSSSGFPEFLQKCLSQLPDGIRVEFIRLDKGYYSRDNLSLLESKGFKYVVKVPSYSTLTSEAMRLSDSSWVKVDREICPNTWLAEMTFHGRRVIVKRVLVEKKDEEKEGLFEPGESYEFSFYATNMDGSPWEIIRFYYQRATIENRIKESKLGFHADRLPSRLMRANIVYLHFVMLAYNLLWWFKSRMPLCEKLSERGIRVFRDTLFLIPAVVVKHPSGFSIHMPEAWPFAELMHRMISFLASPAPA